MGDKYLVQDDKVEGMSLTAETPEWIINLMEKHSLTEETGTVEWLTKGPLLKGFNSSGYLVMIYDATKCLYYIKRTNPDNIITEIRALNYSDYPAVWEFEYYQATGSGNALLKKITECIGGKYVTFTYEGNKLKTITPSAGTTYTLSYTGEEMSCITTSDGYCAEYTKSENTSTVAIKSMYTSIPGNQSARPETMSSWTISYSDNKCTITDYNGDKEYYEISSDKEQVNYAKEVNGVVVSAKREYYEPYVERKVEQADRSCLYKEPYETFDFVSGETTVTELNESNQPQNETMTGRKIAVTDNGFNTLSTTTTYEYNSNGQCWKQITNANYSNGQSYKQTAVMYYTDGEVSELTTNVEKESTYVYERSKILNADGTHTITQLYRLDDEEKGYKSSETYDSYDRKVSEKDAYGTYDIKYSYNADNDRVYSIRRPGYPEIFHSYDASGNLSWKYYTEIMEDEYTEFIGNRLIRTNGELTRLEGNSKINFAYDEKRRIKSITIDGNTGSKTFDYSDQTTDNVAEEVVTATNENGEVIKCVSAKNGSYEKLYYNNKLELETHYDAEGKITTIEDGVLNNTITYEYNALGQVTEYSDGRGTDEKYIYGEYGNISRKEISGAAEQTYEYGYMNNSKHNCNSIRASRCTSGIRRCTSKVTATAEM